MDFQRPFLRRRFLEVYLIAILLAVLQIGGISAGLIGNNCDALIPVFEMMAKPVLKHETVDR